MLDPDHLMIATDDHVAAAATYARLGFLVSPFRPNRPMGGDGGRGGSRLVLLDAGVDDRGNYLELSCADPVAGTPLLKRLLRTPGPAMIVHSTLDIEATRAAWAAARIPAPYYFDAEFPTTGTIGGSRVRILIADPERVPYPVNVVQFSTLEPYRQPNWRRHPNGARRWARVTCLAETAALDRATEFFERLYGRVARERGPGSRTVACDRVEVRIATRDALREDYGSRVLAETELDSARILGFTLEVEDLEATRARLAEGGTRALDLADRVVVPPGAAGGSLIEFVQRPGLRADAPRA